MSPSPVVANLGEWSELYALAFLLVNGGAYAADKRQERIEEEFYKVLEVFVPGYSDGGETCYKVFKNTLQIAGPDRSSTEVEINEVAQHLVRFFAELSAREHTGAFPLEAGQALMTTLSLPKVSLSYQERKSDLDIRYLDPYTEASSPRVGFSIKSQLGSPSTLLNASGATNFIFKILPPLGHQPEHYASFQARGGVKALVGELISRGYRLQFEGLQGDKFTSNLELVDSQLPKYLADLVVAYYASGGSSVKELSQVAFPRDKPGATQQVFKVKQFLGAVAMGLRPTGYWDGDVTKFKGILVVTPAGDVVVYYLSNLTDFQEYLFESVKFETASTTRHGFGEIYDDGGSAFIKLNLQIRFVR
jgi:hypothetical protein